MNQRPRTVPVVAAFLLAATVIAAVVGVSLLFPNAFLDRIWQLNKPAEAVFRASRSISGSFLLLLGAGTCAAAIGLLRRRKWAWWFAVVLFAVDGSGDIVSLIVTGDWFRSASGAVISAMFLYFLCRDAVRNYFKEAS
jgi:hypothetical protein